MTTMSFGPQLIGQTEKALNALLRQILGDRLTEAEWVTMRLAGQLTDRIESSEQLVEQVAERAHFADASGVVHSLTAAGHLANGRPTPTGRAMVSDLQAQIAVRTEPIWRDLPAGDVAAAERILEEVLERASTALHGCDPVGPSHRGRRAHGVSP